MNIENETNPPEIYEDHDGENEGSVAVVMEIVDENDRTFRTMVYLEEPTEAEVADGIATVVNGVAAMRGINLQVAVAQRLGLLP